MSRWKAKHDKEHYYKLAKKQNYRSRASYKLKQLDKKYGLLKPDYNVVDLGAAPFQSCPTLCDHMYSSPPGSSVHRIL